MLRPSQSSSAGVRAGSRSLRPLRTSRPFVTSLALGLRVRVYFKLLVFGFRAKPVPDAHTQSPNDSRTIVLGLVGSGRVRGGGLDGWVGGWVGVLVNGWVGGFVGLLVCGRVGGWVGRWVGAWVEASACVGAWIGRVGWEEGSTTDSKARTARQNTYCNSLV